MSDNPIVLSTQQFEDIRYKDGEYSATIPTCTTIGKRWLCDVNAFRHMTGRYDRKNPQFSWLLCEYQECEPYNEKRVSIHRRPIVIAEALVLGALLQELLGVANPYGGLE